MLYPIPVAPPSGSSPSSFGAIDAHIAAQKAWRPGGAGGCAPAGRRLRQAEAPCRTSLPGAARRNMAIGPRVPGDLQRALRREPADYGRRETGRGRTAARCSLVSSSSRSSSEPGESAKSLHRPILVGALALVLIAAGTLSGSSRRGGAVARACEVQPWNEWTARGPATAAGEGERAVSLTVWAAAERAWPARTRGAACRPSWFSCRWAGAGGRGRCPAMSGSSPGGTVPGAGLSLRRTRRLASFSRCSSWRARSFLALQRSLPLHRGTLLPRRGSARSDDAAPGMAPRRDDFSGRAHHHRRRLRALLRLCSP